VSLDDERTWLERVKQKKMLDEFLHRWFHNAEDGSLTGAFHPFEPPQEFEQLLEGHLRKIIHRLEPGTTDCRPFAHHDLAETSKGGVFSRTIRDLHERRVFRVILGYPVVAWVVLQVADVLANYFGMQTRDFQPLLAGLIGGYPLAIFLSWFLQLTRDGVIIHPAHRDGAGKLHPWRPLAAGVGAIVLATGVGVGAYEFMARGSIGDCEGTIAVLPFQNFSASADDSYLGKGFAEEMLHMLAQIEGMKVASRTASFNLRTENMEFNEIGSRLGVCHVLEGSIRRQGDMLRITVQLIDVNSNFHIWSRTYDREMEDLFAVYEEIAQAITDKLRISLGEDAARTPQILVTNTEAYDHYLQARSILARADDEARLQRADHFFRRAVELDPNFARAWAGRCEAELGIFRLSQDVESVSKAEFYCRKALQSDPTLTEVHVALATVYLTASDFEAAHEELRRAAAEDPDNPDVLRTLGDVFAKEGKPARAEAAFRDAIRVLSTDVRALQSLAVLLFSQGRFEDSADTFQEMVEASGGSSAAYNGLGAALSMLGRFDDAGLAYREVLASEPSGRAYSNVGINYFYQGQFEDAEVMLREAIELSPDDYRLVGNLADALRQLPGREQETQDTYALAAELADAVVVTSPTDVEALSSLGHFYAQLEEFEKAHVAANAALAVDQNDIYANYYASLVWLETGDVDKAIEAIENALNLGLNVVMLRADPQFERLNVDPRYVSLLE
jgi:TolB-like protein/cytochrome c-type biogenesis protein CcmH/NrfG